MSEPDGHMERAVNDTDWSPERKIVGAAIAALLLAVLSITFDVELPVGTEGALAVLVAYFLPNKK